ncbi:MAG TPA: DUF2950 domain-containing protein [Anaeromyxobacteraceae bacterium]|nr:DUF2950 domain-containing protein [Anaeromyxobacteraceae bacterium]
MGEEAGAAVAREAISMSAIQVIAILLSVAPGSLKAAPSPARAFDSPQEAASALVVAAGQQDVPALVAIFGSDGSSLVVSGDDVRDRSDRSAFAELAREKLEVVKDPKNPHKATVVVGNDAWPFPVPLVEQKGKWRFATAQGLQEVLDRRIGSNELDAIEICRGYVNAQQEYALEDRNGDGVPEYAQRVISTEGKRDGLAWRNPDGSIEGPIAEGIADAIAEGYTDKTRPYHGYYFRILKRQGPSARLGEMDYVINGRMIGGFALVAWPAEYASSGVNTFIVDYDGVVYEKDLGSDTAKIVAGMDRYNPDKSWRPVQ